MIRKTSIKRSQNLISEDSSNLSYIQNFPIENISLNSNFPRIKIDELKLNEIAYDIKEKQIIEPLIVTNLNISKKNTYELLIGEKRYRAAKVAGLKTVPIIIFDNSSNQVLELALSENIQKIDLSPIEEAIIFQKMINERNMHPIELAEITNYSESVIRNKVRLLNLPKQIVQGLLEGALSEGHARSLLGLTDESTRIIAYNKVVTQHLSVRTTEEMVKKLNVGMKPVLKARSIVIDKVTSKFEQDLKDYFGNKVNLKLTRSYKGGKIEFKYRNDDELSQILMKIGIN